MEHDLNCYLSGIEYKYNFLLQEDISYQRKCVELVWKTNEIFVEVKANDFFAKQIFLL